MNGELDWIFFDLDMTLWDHEAAAHAAIMEVCRRYELAPMSFLPLFKTSNEYLWRELAKGPMDFRLLRIQRFEMALGQMACGCVSLDAMEISEFYMQHYMAVNRVMPGAIAAVEAAAKVANVAILTTGPHDSQDPKVVQFGDAARMFQHVICADDVGCLKPDPEFYRRAAARVGATDPARLMMVGDSWDSDIEPALALGWRACWIGAGVPPAVSPERLGHPGVRRVNCLGELIMDFTGKPLPL